MKVLEVVSHLFCRRRRRQSRHQNVVYRHFFVGFQYRLPCRAQRELYEGLCISAWVSVRYKEEVALDWVSSVRYGVISRSNAVNIECFNGVVDLGKGDIAYCI